VPQLKYLPMSVDRYKQHQDKYLFKCFHISDFVRIDS
jgi:hypothetical protein